MICHHNRCIAAVFSAASMRRIRRQRALRMKEMKATANILERRGAVPKPRRSVAPTKSYSQSRPQRLFPSILGGLQKTRNLHDRGTSLMHTNFQPSQLWCSNLMTKCYGSAHDARGRALCTFWSLYGRQPQWHSSNSCSCSKLQVTAPISKRITGQ